MDIETEKVDIESVLSKKGKIFSQYYYRMLKTQKKEFERLLILEDKTEILIDHIEEIEFCE